MRVEDAEQLFDRARRMADGPDGDEQARRKLKVL
jgi:hypothetical protein